ncbi:MAG: hypothetical protein HC767_12480 [Akkermansiaceae bacterium]|nr:hypothetical protein [Akkermansiaceae bacterium]
MGAFATALFQTLPSIEKQLVAARFEVAELLNGSLFLLKACLEHLSHDSHTLNLSRIELREASDAWRKRLRRLMHEVDALPFSKLLMPRLNSPTLLPDSEQQKPLFPTMRSITALDFAHCNCLEWNPRPRTETSAESLYHACACTTPCRGVQYVWQALLANATSTGRHPSVLQKFSSTEAAGGDWSQRRGN